MLSLIYVVFLLQSPAGSSALRQFGCNVRMANTVWKDGDVFIGVFLPMYTYMSGAHDKDYGSKYRVYQADPSKYQFVMALVFAVEEINRDPHLLPNMTLRYIVYESEPSYGKTLLSTMRWLTGLDKAIPNHTCRGQMNFISVITGTSWEISSQIGNFLELYNYPQLTIGPFYPMLSDRVKFPTLYQMAPKDTSLALGMVSLMVHFSWTWVGLVILENENGVRFLTDLRREMERYRVCAAFVQMVKVDHNSIENDLFFDSPSIKSSTANVIIVFGDTESSIGSIFMTSEHILPWRVWVTTSQWDVASSMRHFILDHLHGSLIFSPYHPEISGFKDFIQTVNPAKYPDDVFLSQLWSIYFDCPYSLGYCKSMKNCSSKGSLASLPWHVFDMDMSEGSYQIYNAVYAVAHSLHEMLLQEVDVGAMDHWKRQIIKPWQLHPVLKNIQFDNPIGERVNMDQTGKSDAEYDILNFWNFPQGFGQKVHVGRFSPSSPPGQQLSLSEDLIEWSTGFSTTPICVCSASCAPGFRKSPQEGKAACCFDCTLCPENEISNETDKGLWDRHGAEERVEAAGKSHTVPEDTDQCVRCPGDKYANIERNHCLQKAETFLAYEDPLGMALACMALCFSVLTALVLGIFVKHQDTPIVKANNINLSYLLLISLTFCFLCSLLFIGPPSTASCLLQQITFGVLFTVAVSTVLAKTITVVLAFRITAPGRRMRELLISGAPNYVIPICTLIQLLLCGFWLGTSPPFVDTDAHSEHGHIILLCNKGSVTAFYCVLGYLGALALASFTVAFLARNLPDTFNEAKFLTFSMLVFCSVWVTFLPVYHSTKGKVMVAVEVFSILASSAGLLGCIFFPKCYVIFMRPEKICLKMSKNTREQRKHYV